MKNLDSAKLNTLFAQCRQCGTCCKSYKKVPLEPDEIERMKKLGAHVGLMLSLNDLRNADIDTLIKKEAEKGKVYMIHPDEKGCIFLEKKNEKCYCKIYHYRPKACQGFKCNIADNTISDLFLNDPIHLLGMDRYGRKLD